MHLACCITAATDVHSEYAKIIVFRGQESFHESASVLRYSALPVLYVITNQDDGKYEGRSEINASYLFPWKLH